MSYLDRISDWDHFIATDEMERCPANTLYTHTWWDKMAMMSVTRDQTGPQSMIEQISLFVFDGYFTIERTHFNI